MTELFRRDCLVRVQVAAPEAGTDQAAAIELQGLDVQFQVEKNLQNEPNKCSLTMYNLLPETARALEALNTYDPKRSKGEKRAKGKWDGKSARAPKSGKIRVEIEAGYVGLRGLIFRGDLRRATTERTRTGTTTKIEGEDGGRSILASRIRETFPEGTSYLTVAKACISAMGLGTGNITDVEDLLGALKVSGGLTLSGVASQELTAVTRRLGARWSVQNGVMRWERRDREKARGYLLSKDTGMVGYPVRTSTGEVEVVALLNPELQVGGYVTLESVVQQYTGSYQISAVQYTGDTRGSDWFAKLTLRAA